MFLLVALIELQNPAVDKKNIDKYGETSPAFVQFYVDMSVNSLYTLKSCYAFYCVPNCLKAKVHRTTEAQLKNSPKSLQIQIPYRYRSFSHL